MAESVYNGKLVDEETAIKLIDADIKAQAAGLDAVEANAAFVQRNAAGATIYGRRSDIGDCTAY